MPVKASAPFPRPVLVALGGDFYLSSSVRNRGTNCPPLRNREMFVKNYGVYNLWSPAYNKDANGKPVARYENDTVIFRHLCLKEASPCLPEKNGELKKR